MDARGVFWLPERNSEKKERDERRTLTQVTSLYLASSGRVRGGLRF